ncbi:GNAT family N-acetyltransferase [Streptomyces bobili]|uniref:GNAT family N-acetyltransferase n=1 Tax=Streptomyces bobili TaxID=67280 RepID=UPI003724BDDB
MSVQLSESVALQGYDAVRNEDVNGLENMFTRYLLEELDRTGEMAFGNPVAGYLSTSLFRCAGEPVGFLSLDAGRFSVEVIYVLEQFRGRGLATLALAECNRHCPQTLALKTPLSPGGEALAARLGLDLADNTPAEAAKNQAVLRSIQKSIRTGCQHKAPRTGDPRKPCRRCYRTGLRRYASVVIRKHAQAERLLAGLFQT